MVVTALEMGLLWVVVHPLRVPHWAAYIGVQFFANLGTFVLYKVWAFEAKERGSARHQYLKQLLVFGGSLALNTAIPSLLSYRLHVEPVLAFALSNVVVYLGWNYPGNRYFVFSDRR